MYASCEIGISAALSKPLSILSIISLRALLIFVRISTLFCVVGSVVALTLRRVISV